MPGASWDAPDPIVRYQVQVVPGEIQFQPGTWLVRASVAKHLAEERGAVSPETPVGGEPPDIGPQQGAGQPSSDSPDTTPAASDPTSVVLSIRGVPPDKVRDVLT